MLSLAYVSSASDYFSEEELAQLLASARSKNARLELTGALLYENGRFIQVLEGPEVAVRALYAKIKADPRHRGFHMVSNEHITVRQFPDWTMGFHSLADSDVSQVSGFNKFFEQSDKTKSPLESARRARALLEWLRNYWLLSSTPTK